MKIFRSLSFLAVLAAGFFIFGLGVRPAEAAIVVHSGYEYISTDTVWHTGDVHSVVGDDSAIFVDYGVTLTIEPGVTVKFDSNGSLWISGKLIAGGTTDQPVVFTSLKNDAYGGDSNGDGSTTMPAPGDWHGLVVPLQRDDPYVPVDGELKLNHVIISYGGRYNDNNMSVIELAQSPDCVISNSELFDNIGPIIIYPAAVGFSMTNSNIYAPDYCQDFGGQTVCGGMIMNNASVAFDVSGNYWGSASGPTVVGPSGPVFGGTGLYGNFSYQPFSAEKLDLFAGGLDPVIIIPGIMGSWKDFSGTWQLDPITHTYDDLLEALRAAGYEDGKTLFAFPYEWRNSNVITAELLRQKIADIKTATGAAKVDLIGHSMGGLVARAYIEGDNYQNDVDQLIFIATPHKGAPASYLMWEGGEKGNKKIDDIILSQIIKIEAAEHGYISLDGKGVVQYLRAEHIDSVKELLPIYSYIFDQKTNKIRLYSNNYPRNEFLENLNSADNLEKLNGVKVLNILGDTGDDTISALFVVTSTKPLPLWENGMPYAYYNLSGGTGLFKGAGDGTVPTISNHNFNSSTELVINQDHGKVVSYSQKEVIKELTGTEPTTEIRKPQLRNLLLLAMHSPADFQVIAPDGKVVGRNFNASSTIINEIPDAFYSGFDVSGTPEFIAIPNPLDGDYQIKTLGVSGGGSYTVTADYFSETSSTNATYTGTIADGGQETLAFSVASSSEALLTNLKSTVVTVQTAIKDLNWVYANKLLTNKSANQKLYQKYSLLQIKSQPFAVAKTLATNFRTNLNSNIYLNTADKAQMIAEAEAYLLQIQADRQAAIAGDLDLLDALLAQLLSSGLLKQQGYDIMKADNDYLRNNW